MPFLPPQTPVLSFLQFDKLAQTLISNLGLIDLIEADDRSLWNSKGLCGRIRNPELHLDFEFEELIPIDRMRVGAAPID